MAEPTVLYLLRHGEIDRPPVAQFDDAVLTPAGRMQIHELALRWTLPLPVVIYCSPLPRSIETAGILAAVWRRPVRPVHGLEEWAATERDVPQEMYVELERRCWANFDYQNDEGESLRHATRRTVNQLTAIARRHRGRPSMVSGHAILFALFLAHIQGKQATERSKNTIGFGHWAVVTRRGSIFRLFRPFGP